MPTQASDGTGNQLQALLGAYSRTQRGALVATGQGPFATVHALCRIWLLTALHFNKMTTSIYLLCHLKKRLIQHICSQAVCTKTLLGKSAASKLSLKPTFQTLVLSLSSVSMQKEDKKSPSHHTRARSLSRKREHTHTHTHHITDRDKNMILRNTVTKVNWT